MNRREFLTGTLSAAVVAGASGAKGAEQGAPAKAAEPLFATKPHAQLMAPDVVALVWETSVQATGRVTWRQGENEAWREGWWETDGFKDANDTKHRAVLEGVDSSKPIWFRVHSRAIAENKAYWVKYAGEEETYEGQLDPFLSDPTAFSFAMVNDVHAHVDTYPKLLRFLERPVAFTAFAGDIIRESWSADYVRQKLIVPLGDWTEASRAPIWYVRGNHETRAGYARHLRDHLALQHDHYYGAVTFGETRIVFLDTGEDKEDSHREYFGTVAFDHYLACQTDWLKREVASDAWMKARHRIVIGHIPPFVRKTGNGQSFDPFQPRLRALFKVLETAKVSLFCAGHLHRSGFEAPIPERPYPIIIGGGQATDKIAWAQPTLTRLDVSAKGLRIRQWRIDGTLQLDQSL